MKSASQLKSMGEWYEENGDYESAELMLRSAILMEEQLVGEDSLELVTDLHNLGLLCYALEKYEEAEALLRRAWMIETQKLGPMHPDTLATLNAISDLSCDWQKEGDGKGKYFAFPISQTKNGSRVYH
jgi:tetratricopeptide (TPR) repeat protein